ncbi:heterogeneous nuclear ribonucleoprotein A1-like [Diadema antillarum]|uniref:heterogeneous nuclear ribonucleoprotein A1-like n=1 Tax=Diadema antillarum TaxID=105358 RepID=UPI003A886810
MAQPQSQYGGLDLEEIHKEINEPEEDRKLFLGGLKSTTTEKHLYEAFIKYGILVDVCVIRGPNYKPRGFGFVTFQKSAMMEGVLADAPDMRFMVEGKYVELKRIERKKPPRQSKSTNLPEADEDTLRIFVGGIPDVTTDKILRNFFEQFGEVGEVIIPLSEKTQKPRGFGFVTFFTKEVVARVCGE